MGQTGGRRSKTKAFSRDITRVITYGTYDLLHTGHLRLLERAKKLGDYLIVGVSTDSFNAVKGKKNAQDFKTRVKILKSLKIVDKVIVEKSWDQKIRDIKKYKVDIFVMGSDWKGKFDFLKEYCKVIYLKRTPNISTTQLKKRIKNL